MQSETTDVILFGYAICRQTDEMTISWEEACGAERRSGSDREEPLWLKALFLHCLHSVQGTKALPFVSENCCPLPDFWNHHHSNPSINIAAQQNISATYFTQYVDYMLLFSLILWHTNHDLYPLRTRKAPGFSWCACNNLQTKMKWHQQNQCVWNRLHSNTSEWECLFSSWILYFCVCLWKHWYCCHGKLHYPELLSGASIQKGFLVS